MEKTYGLYEVVGTTSTDFSHKKYVVTQNSADAIRAFLDLESDTQYHYNITTSYITDETEIHKYSFEESNRKKS